MTEETPQPLPKLRNVPAETVGAGLAELLAHVLGVNWTASVLAPAMAVVARTVWEADRRQWQQAAQAVSIATEELAGDSTLIKQQALSDPARTELFRRVVQAAGRSPIEEKIPALGRVLAAGLPDGARVDTALLLAAALTVIEAPHAQVLKQITGPWPDSKPDARNTRGQPNGRISAVLPTHREILPAILETLRAAGLIEDVGFTARQEADKQRGGVKYTPRDPRWRPTWLGQQCSALLQQLPLPEPEPDPPRLS